MMRVPKRRGTKRVVAREMMVISLPRLAKVWDRIGARAEPRSRTPSKRKNRRMVGSVNAIQIRHRDKRGHATEKVRRVADSNRSNRGRVRPARTPPRMQEKGPVASRDKARVDQSKAPTRRAPKVNS